MTTDYGHNAEMHLHADLPWLADAGRFALPESKVIQHPKNFLVHVHTGFKQITHEMHSVETAAQIT